MLSQSLPEAGFVRLPTVLSLIPVSRSTWWAGIRSGRFPAPVRNGRVTMWSAEKHPRFHSADREGGVIMFPAKRSPSFVTKEKPYRADDYIDLEAAPLRGDRRDHPRTELFNRNGGLWPSSVDALGKYHLECAPCLRHNLGRGASGP